MLGPAQCCPSSLAFLVHEAGDGACQALRFTQHEREHDEAKYLYGEPADSDPGEQRVVAHETRS